MDGWDGYLYFYLVVDVFRHFLRRRRTTVSVLGVCKVCGEDESQTWKLKTEAAEVFGRRIIFGRHMEDAGGSGIVRSCGGQMKSLHSLTLDSSIRAGIEISYGNLLLWKDRCCSIRHNYLMMKIVVQILVHIASSLCTEYSQTQPIACSPC